MRFSHRVGDQSLHAFNTLSLHARQLRSQGIGISQLNDSNPTHHGLSVHSPEFIYTASARGDDDTRRVLADYLSQRYEQSLDPQRLYVLNSTSQAYAWLMMLLCDPSDYVLYPKPGYPLIESICALTGVQSAPYRLDYDGSWTIDYVSIEEQLLQHNSSDDSDAQPLHPIKAIILINPNNPTGSYVKASERERIVELCERYGVAIVADEVFYDFALHPFSDRQRLVGERRVLTFALDGFSKMLAAPDVKVGWIYVSGPHDDVVRAQEKLDLIADDFLPMSSYITREIPSLLQRADSQTQLIRQRCAENLRWIIDYTSDATCTQGVVSVVRAEGGWSALLRYPASIEDDELGLALLDRNHAMSAPGYFFDFESSGYMSVSLLPHSDIFKELMIDTIRTIESFITEI